MTDVFSDRYYVYHHVCPLTQNILYVGHGCGARAWMYDVPFRSENHAEYLNSLVSQGYLPSDWVTVVYRGLEKTYAASLERADIDLLDPTFNKIQGEKLLKFTPEMLIVAVKLREQGMSYQKIADTLEVSLMVAHRALTGRNKALEKIIARSK